jgi:hypothetical protein
VAAAAAKGGRGGYIKDGDFATIGADSCSKLRRRLLQTGRRRAVRRPARSAAMLPQAGGEATIMLLVLVRCHGVARAASVLPEWTAVLPKLQGAAGVYGGATEAAAVQLGTPHRRRATCHTGRRRKELFFFMDGFFFFRVRLLTLI